MPGVGLLDAPSPYTDPDPGLTEVLVAGMKAGRDQIDDLGKHPAPPVNGWTTTLHHFHYNLDFFEVGTIDTPEWKVADGTIAFRPIMRMYQPRQEILSGGYRLLPVRRLGS